MEDSYHQTQCLSKYGSDAQTDYPSRELALYLLKLIGPRDSEKHKTECMGGDGFPSVLNSGG